MKVELDIEHGLLSAVLLRCQREKLSLDEVVNAWLRRANRQDKTLLPTSETRKVVNIGTRS